MPAFLVTAVNTSIWAADQVRKSNMAKKTSIAPKSKTSKTVPKKQTASAKKTPAKKAARKKEASVFWGFEAYYEQLQEWRDARINKQYRTQEYTLPVYTCDSTSLLNNFFQKLDRRGSGLSVFLNNEYRVNKELPSVYSLHFRDFISSSKLILIPMDIEIYCENKSDQMSYAGVLPYAGSYILVTDAVASFLTLVAPDSTLTFTREYIEYDLDARHKFLTTGYLEWSYDKKFP